MTLFLRGSHRLDFITSTLTKKNQKRVVYHEFGKKERKKERKIERVVLNFFFNANMETIEKLTRARGLARD